MRLRFILKARLLHRTCLALSKTSVCYSIERPRSWSSSRST
jgi:hypothetical protein